MHWTFIICGFYLLTHIIFTFSATLRMYHTQLNCLIAGTDRIKQEIVCGEFMLFLSTQQPSFRILLAKNFNFIYRTRGRWFRRHALHIQFKPEQSLIGLTFLGARVLLLHHTQGQGLSLFSEVQNAINSASSKSAKWNTYITIYLWFPNPESQTRPPYKPQNSPIAWTISPGSYKHSLDSAVLYENHFLQYLFLYSLSWSQS